MLKAWVKIFRIIPEFRIFRLTFNLKMLEEADYYSFSDLFSDKRQLNI